MKHSFDQISPEVFEFFCEDLLKLMGFTIESRPGRGPDQGKDLLAVRLVTDDMNISQMERWLVECKHFGGSQRSVLESDVGNIESRMKIHKANRYLLVTSTTVSSTVRNQLQAISEDAGTIYKAAFWGSTDLHEKLLKYDKLIEKYFHSWDVEAVEAVAYIKAHFFEAHRGALLWLPCVTAVFGNDGYSAPEAKEQVERIRARLKSLGIQVLSFAVCEDDYSYALLVDSNDARTLHDLTWSCVSDRIRKLPAFSLEEHTASCILWTYMSQPHKSSLPRSSLNFIKSKSHDDLD